MLASRLPGSARSWAVTSLVACVSLVIFRLLDYFPLVVVSKLLASTAFLFVAARAGALEHAAGRWMFAGLALSWIGDALLLDDLSALFIAGLASFLVAHVAYTVAFVAKGVSRRWVMMVVFPVALVSTGAWMWLEPHIAPYMTLPVQAYTLVITIMVIAAIGVWGAGASAMIPIGALLFYFSDLSVAAGKFVQPDFPNYVWGLPFYYLGQVLLALSSAPTRRAAKTP